MGGGYIIKIDDGIQLQTKALCFLLLLLLTHPNKGPSAHNRISARNRISSKTNMSSHLAFKPHTGPLPRAETVFSSSGVRLAGLTGMLFGARLRALLGQDDPSL